MIDIEKLVAATKRAAELANEKRYNIYISAHEDGCGRVSFQAWDDDMNAVSGTDTVMSFDISGLLIAFENTVEQEREHYAKKREAEDTANELDYLRNRNKQLEEEIKMLQGR